MKNANDDRFVTCSRCKGEGRISVMPFGKDSAPPEPAIMLCPQPFCTNGIFDRVAYAASFGIPRADGKMWCHEPPGANWGRPRANSKPYDPNNTGT